MAKGAKANAVIWYTLNNNNKITKKHPFLRSAKVRVSVGLEEIGYLSYIQKICIINNRQGIL